MNKGIKKETGVHKNDILKRNKQKLLISRKLNWIFYVFLMFAITTISESCDHIKPNILIIGDSISIGYTPFVENYFSGKAFISHNPGNAQHTGTGLNKIEEWIESENWDIIQINWGLWDLCYRHPASTIQGNRDKVNGKLTSTMEEYASNLDSIVSIIQKNSSAKLIFVTTTYVPENEAGRFENDVIKYNEAAKTIMQKRSVIVNDIYPQSIAIHQSFGKGKDDVHYTIEGYEKLGKLVALFIENEIKSKQ